MTLADFLTRWATLDWPALQQATMTTTLDGAVAGARAQAPVRLGILQQSIHGEIEGNGTRGLLTSDVAYAAFQNDGTRPHAIVPRAGRVLRFPVGGQIVFTTHVQHPGIPARHFMEAGLLAGQTDVERAWPQIVAAWWRL